MTVARERRFDPDGDGRSWRQLTDALHDFGLITDEQAEEAYDIADAAIEERVAELRAESAAWEARPWYRRLGTNPAKWSLDLYRR